MLDTIEIVPLDHHLLDAAASFRADIFGGSEHESRRYIIWKYLENPYLDPPIVHLALHGERVVGMRGSMGTCWELDDVRYVIPQGGDLIVDPAYRRQGLARRMMSAGLADMAKRGLGTTVALSANELGTAAAAGAGWRPLMPLIRAEWRARGSRRFWERPLPARRVEALRNRALALLPRPAPFAALDASDENASHRRDVAPDQLSQLAARSKPPSNRLRHVRDAEYFRWRFGNPLAEYRVLASPDAYVVFHWDRFEPYVNLVDWRWADIRSALDVLGTGLCRLRTVRTWNACLDRRVVRMLDRAGDLDRKAGAAHTFLVRSTAPLPSSPSVNGLDLADPSSWDLRLLDSDAF